ncbi:MAG: PH domain-containing protein, partial [Acidimicrobiales bacterium]
PLDRIQQIATEQGIVQQIFNVRKIRVDTAGSASAEFTLSAVDDAVVLQLRKAVVGADKAGTAPPPPVDGIAVPHEPRPGLATESRVLDRQDRRTMLLRHEIRDLVELAVARPNGQLLAAIVAVSTLGLGGVVRSLLADSDIGSIAAMLLGAVGLAILIVVLIASTVLREFELTVWRSDEGLRLTAGLFKKREQFARTERVQLVRYRNNLVERWFNRTSVYFPQASATGGGIEGAATRQLFGVPGAPDSRLDELTSQFLPTERPPLNEAISKNAITRWTLWGGLVPALMLLLIATISALIEGLTLLPIVIGVVAISFVIVARLIARRVHRGWRWGIDCGVINSQNGVINISRVAVAIRKVQSVRLHQGWWHRRNGLATIEFGTAGGSLRLPYLPIEVAQGLRDDVLLAVESDTGAWM